MPLSEHEQRLLEQMERALYAEDPKLASTLRGADLRSHQRRSLVLGALGLLIGLGLLLAGVTIGWPLGVLGFLVMLASAWWMLSAWRGSAAPSGTATTPGNPRTPSGSARSAHPKGSRPVMDRFEERWRRRREGNDH